MNLRELIDYKSDIKKEKLIGRELMIADKPALLLGLQEVHASKRSESGGSMSHKEYRGKGFGTEMMRQMLLLLKTQGYEKASLAVQKETLIGFSR